MPRGRGGTGRCFNAYRAMQHDGAEVAALKQKLLAAPIAPSFAKRYASYEGVCMGNRKTCTCGAPFFS